MHVGEGVRILSCVRKQQHDAASVSGARADNNVEVLHALPCTLA